jgi:hypothetical protein
VFEYLFDRTDRGGHRVGADKLDVVRKLLAKAERAATQAEAEAYTAKAVELMARHGIDEALLAAAEPGRDQLGGSYVTMSDPYSAGKARLLASTAAALRCRTVLHAHPGGRVAGVTVFGFAADRERIELLYTSLLLQAGTQLVRQRPAWADESVAAYRRSWLHGFAQEVYRRLVAAERRAAEEHAPASGSTEAKVATPPEPLVELVLADRDDQVESAFAAAYGHIPKARPASLSGSGLRAGAAAGRRADLGGRALTRRPSTAGV